MKPVLFDGSVSFGGSLYPRPAAKALIRLNPEFARWDMDCPLPPKWMCTGGATTAVAQTKERAWQDWACQQAFVERYLTGGSRRGGALT
jgi:hypothetical protein